MSASRTRPLSLLTLGWVTFFGVYIVVSTRWATRAAESVDELSRLEQGKGLAFAALSGVVFFTMIYVWARRVAASEVRLQRQHEELLAAERQAMVGLLTATLAHDVRNLLMVGEANLQDVRGANPDLRGSKEIRELESALRSVREYADHLSRLGRDSSPTERRQVDLSQLVADALGLVRKHPLVAGCRVRREVGGPSTLHVNPPALERALVNLVLNAAQATGGAGTILVRTQARDGRVRLEVHDDGPGIAPEDRSRFLEPFSAPEHGHAGLGLVSVRACVEGQGGRVEIGESPLGGACVALDLPLD